MSRLLITLSLLTGGLLAGCNGKGGEDPPAADAASGDRDGDGVADAEDCNPDNGAVYAGAPELEDFVDNNCDGRIDEGTDRYDDDGDGYSDYEGDCDDGEAAVNPEATEVPYDGVDQDCDGADLTDVDGDGYDSELVGGSDCDDALSAVHPDAEEWANGVDDNCDGAIDEGTDGYDDDGDGYSEAEGDCDDTDDTINPGATEIAYDGVDNDCDFYDLRDVDGDGYDSELVGGSDCDDGEPSIHPEAAEVPYDDIDQDCDGADLTDIDGDGWLPADGDCDDTDPDANPGMDETPDYIDNDCDSAVDEGTLFGDDDGDGYSEAEGDCDDEDSGQYPGAVELVDGVDNDCNDLIDERNLDDAVAILGDASYIYFGYTIDVGDINGDGVQDLSVGARYDDDSSNNAGQAWVVSGDTAGGVINDEALFSVVGVRSNGYLGTTVKFIPDMDGDGADELLVSAPYDYLPSTRNEGLTYLIAGGTYDLQTPVNTAAADVLRGGVSNEYSPDDLAAGDWNGDGFGDYALGDDGYDILMTNRGAAFIFDGSVGPGALGIADVPDAADVTILGAGSIDYLGSRLESLPDIDGDGYEELLIRAINEYSAYLFDGYDLFASGSTSASSATAIFSAPTGGSGWANSMSAGDFDGDGDADIVIANYSYDGELTFFDNGGSGFSGVLDASTADAVVYGNFDNFGYSAASADVDGDGMDEVIAGAYDFSELETGAGAVFVLDADDLAAIDGSDHSEVGRPVLAEEASLYWGYSTVAADDWWAAGTYGSSGPNNGAVYLIPFDD